MTLPPKRCNTCGGLLKLTPGIEQSACICKNARSRMIDYVAPIPRLERAPAMDPPHVDFHVRDGGVYDSIRKIANKVK